MGLLIYYIEMLCVVLQWLLIDIDFFSSHDLYPCPTSLHVFLSFSVRVDM